MEGNGTGNRKHKWQVQNGLGEVKNSMGNGEAKEFICMTHGHFETLPTHAKKKRNLYLIYFEAKYIYSAAVY